MRKKHRTKRTISRAGRRTGSHRAVAPRGIDIPPTPEFEAKRRALAGGGNWKLCSDPLGVLLARKLITRGQYDAGGDYARLYRQRNGNPHPKSISLEGGGGGGRQRSERADVSIRQEYRSAKRALLRCGRATANTVEAIAVFEDLSTALDERNAENIARGLGKLRHHFRIKS
jgi:hypothetical protein